ncbi:hypothetical protein GCM10010912_23900 [Paenibacillus albidus]|uniref:DUF4190 domain-containing protein n=1 Tax=Paenibacillus albidus TaxID=2041023 RepID=A0A917CBB1_9BACL|nr:DUF5353 domain-containing protein [Paenibacillus albidus]GGF78079.1 hypothetical protein GCM10010912_23900 [Paenibacillus albidus]
MDTEKDDSTRADGSHKPRRVILRPRRVDYPRRERKHEEEYAAEVSPLPVHVRQAEAREQGEETAPREGAVENSRWMGYLGLGFGIASLFMWSVILGPVAAILGYFAYTKGQKTAGAWAMGLGIVATLSYFVMIPFAR